MDIKFLYVEECSTCRYATRKVKQSCHCITVDYSCCKPDINVNINKEPYQKCSEYKSAHSAATVTATSSVED